jgi:hypothetical protein
LTFYTNSDTIFLLGDIKMKNKLTLLDVDPPEWLDKIDRKTSFIENIQINLGYIATSIRMFFNNIYYGVKNVFYYFPVIWKDRYWDFEYFFLQILKYKLRNTRDGIYSEDIIKEKNEVKEEINTLLEYINTFENSTDIFEDNNQNLLLQIKNEEDEYIKDNLVKDYVIKSTMFEINSFNKIFDYLKENCGKWWS